jgi:hypothetical protein
MQSGLCSRQSHESWAKASVKRMEIRCRFLLPATPLLWIRQGKSLVASPHDCCSVWKMFWNASSTFVDSYSLHSACNSIFRSSPMLVNSLTCSLPSRYRRRSFLMHLLIPLTFQRSLYLISSLSLFQHEWQDVRWMLLMLILQLTSREKEIKPSLTSVWCLSEMGESKVKDRECAF